MNGWQSHKMLICDDDEAILDVTSMLLEDAGYQVIAQVNSTKVIYQAISEKPDIMLIDIWMPLPGNELTLEIKKTALLAHIPVILFSAAIDGNSVAKEAGADYFIEKPFDINRLTTLIRTALH